MYWVVVIFLILRQFILWYWRINDAVNSLESISFSLIKINDYIDKSSKDKSNGGKKLEETPRQVEEENLTENKIWLVF